ncbi:Photosystem I P700 chlorophyll a apoprotein A2 [Nymphaea thermarum]|nr:Photosystem I P700 chlorophyll a apoprotein A2 [Nymphaea thermarum]
MGWLRDYLWLNSSQIINGYNPFGMTSLSVWAWMFLFGHLVWATGFMFLISWHGYWQELIETLAWAHERTLLANLIRWRDKPVALSIVQARLVGLAHFSVGYIFIYATFLIASTSGKFVWEGVLIDKKEESTSTDMPLGTTIHNIEITLGKGGQLARAAGAVAKLIAKEGKSATLYHLERCV